LSETISSPLIQGTATGYQAYTAAVLSAQMPALMEAMYPDTGSLNYAQAGFRFSTSIGSSDLGLQYYYGRLGQPVLIMGGYAASLPGVLGQLAAATNETDVNTALAGLVLPEIRYNPYHHIGLDYARVAAGFNLRAEAALNLTSDLDGDDGGVYNPALAWSLGFDRDLFWGLNLNLQANQSLRLFNGGVNSSPLLDIEAETPRTSTRITGVIIKRLLRDKLELRAAAVWGVEDEDFLITPAVTWTQSSLSFQCSGGFFGGSHDGQLGQYYENHFIKIGLNYAF
jgi:hypothetical protein